MGFDKGRKGEVPGAVLCSDLEAFTQHDAVGGVVVG
jgi:hypothetical protein